MVRRSVGNHGAASDDVRVMGVGMTDQRSQDLGPARVAESVRRALLLVGPAEDSNRRIDEDRSEMDATPDSR